MLLYFYLFVPLLFLSGDASSIRGRNNKNELVPFGSSELDTQGKENKLRTVVGEPFLVKLRMSMPSDAKQTKERDKKRQRFAKKRVYKQKHLKKKHRARRDLLVPKSKHRVEKTDLWENTQADNATDDQLKEFMADRVEVLKALSTFSKKRENGYFKDEHKDGTPKGKHGTGLNRNHPKHRHSPSDHQLHVKMVYPATPKTDKRKYTHKDLIADRKRLEQKINYIKNMLSVNETTTDDPIRIRRRSESDKTANKIAKMFLTLSAMNGLQDRRKSKCKFGEEEDEEEDRLQDVWEKQRRHSPTQRTSSSNEERYKVKKWIEFMKNKRSSGKTCPCMARETDESDDFPLEQRLPKDYFLMERSRSSEESSEICRDPYCCRDKLMEQHKKRIKGQEDQDKSKAKNGKKKLELPLNDLEMYRTRAKQILQNAEEILDKIKYEEERRMSTPNILMNQLKELTSRIQSDPRNNENDLIRKIQKNLGWAPLSKSNESPDGNGFMDNVKSYILDPYEKAKALTDESAKMLSTYLLRNLGKMEESSEEQEPDQSDHVYFGRIQTKEDEKPMAASLAKEADLLSKNKEELQNWEDTITKIMTGAEEAVQAESESANNREVFKNRIEDIIKEQQKKVTDYEISHQNSQETHDQTVNLQQKEEIVSGNAQTPSERSENGSNKHQHDEVKSAQTENLSERSEDDKGNTNGNQQEVKSLNIENPSEISEKDQTAEQLTQSQKTQDNYHQTSGRTEENDRNVQQQEEVKSSNPENSSKGLEENADDITANQQEKVELVNPENQKDETEDRKGDRNAQQQEEGISENPENPKEGLEEDRADGSANEQEEVKSEKPENSKEASENDKNDPIATPEEVKSPNPENTSEQAEDIDDRNAEKHDEVKSAKPETSRKESEDKDDQNENRQEEVKSEKPENSNEGSEEDKDDPTTNQEEEVKLQNLENPREGSEEDKEDRNTEQHEEVKSANPEISREESEEGKDDQNANRQEEVKEEKPENSNDGSEEDKDDPTANQEEEVESANPESEQLSIRLGPNDPEEDTADKARETVEKNKEPKKSSSSSKEESSHLEKDNPENTQEELDKEILEEIIKAISENSDSVGNEDSQENPQTVREEEENEDEDAESPKTTSEMQDKNLSSSRLADDYDVLEETTETGGNEAENPTGAILQKQKPLEMREESDSEDKSTKDNPELSNPSEDDEETDLENEKGGDSLNDEEKQTDVEEITKESGNPDAFTENVNPNEDNLKPEHDDEKYQTEAETRQEQENEKDGEQLESTLKEGEAPHRFRYMDEADDGPDYHIQAKNTENEENESREDVSNKTPLREVLENLETQKVLENDDEPSGKKDETNLEMAKETDSKKMNDDDVESDESNVSDEVREIAKEAPQQKNLNEESDEDKTVLQKSNPNENENDAQNSDESLEKAGEGNSYEEDNQKSINSDRNPENERASANDETSEDLSRQNTDDPASGDQTEEDVQGTLTEGEDEERDESSEESKSETLKVASEHINQEDDETARKSANQDEVDETLKQTFAEEQEESEGSETGSRATSKGQNNQDEYLKKESSIENVDKTKESLEVDLADVDPKENAEDDETPRTDQSGETVRTSLDDPKTEQTENLEEEEETPLRSALGDQLENSPNRQSVEETRDTDSSDERTGDIRADITDDSGNQLYLENKQEIPLKSDKSGESLEGRSYEENLGENLILENEETPVRKSNPEQTRAGFPVQKSHHQTPKLKIPKSIGQIMKDLNGKDDVMSGQNLNPDKIDDIIDKIDEAEQQNLLEDPVDCRKECACADEINTRSRNIGRYEIAKDFLHWMKDLQLNRVLSDD